ncbi:hypothetical protein NP493_2692g00007 [Ridgeia piscesae]|uniref:Uncharacterized protein n=1 Tax=Ridgeia piscesae TaxID=27915 RepID=A0AAD9N100_RIDPI|nr:hypothetical protein NP493_2692g00007 [Ridgeia piscesae]
MAPVRQSARQKARGRPVQATDPSSVDPARRLATAAATGVAHRRHLANSQVRQDTTASLRKDLDEIRDLLRSVLPGAASATPVPVAGPSEPPLPPLDMPGAGSVAPLGLLPWTLSRQWPLVQATKLFQYRHIIRNLLERGGDWRGYDESFRTMRASEGWEWDEMHSQLWLMAAQRPIPKQAPQIDDFRALAPWVNKHPTALPFHISPAPSGHCRDAPTSILGTIIPIAI